MRLNLVSCAFALLAVALALAGGGCKSKNDAPKPAEPAAREQGQAGEGEAAPNVGPETSGVKIDLSKGWCNSHGVPESVCTRCDESLVAQFKAAGDWCSGHNLPESQCVKCNPQVKAKWAALKPKEPPGTQPQSTGEIDKPGTVIGRPAMVSRLLTGKSDPLCDVDQAQIRFADETIARKAGIEVQPASRRRMSAAIEVPAETEFDGRKLVRVTPRVKGVIVEVRADVGASVAAGDVLAIIESPELGEAKSRYLELRENLELAQADFERADAVLAGTRRLMAAVTATAPAGVGQDLSEIVAGEAKGKLLNAHAELLLARSNFERAGRLKAEGAGSEQAYEAAAGALRKAESDLQATREAAVFESTRSRLAAEKALKIARNALEVAGRRLHILGLTGADIDKLGSGPDEGLARYELRAPFAGQIIERRAVMGEAVDERDALYTVADLSTMWLELNVSQADAVLLNPGQVVQFTADGLPGESFDGQLTWVSSQMDERTRTVRARAMLPNERGHIRAKMFGTSRVRLRANSEVLSVPDNAVQSDGCCQLVFVRKGEALFEPRKVALGAAAGGYVEILNGLAEGEAVVTTGSFLMKTEILKSSIGAGCCEADAGR
jgi:membrane fusion protein, heavy metal efflux system